MSTVILIISAIILMLTGLLGRDSFSNNIYVDVAYQFVYLLMGCLLIKIA